MDHTKRLIIAGAIGVVTLGHAAACNRTPADQEAEARKAQQQATETAVEAQREADDKAQKVSHEAKQEIADTQRAANERAAKAQEEANQQAQQATQTLSQAKTDYRTKAQGELDDLKATIGDLHTKAASAKSQKRAALNTSLRTYETRRMELQKELGAVDQVNNSDEFGRETADLEKRIDRLREELKDAYSEL